MQELNISIHEMKNAYDKRKFSKTFSKSLYEYSELTGMWITGAPPK